jgi:hypothetical protein
MEEGTTVLNKMCNGKQFVTVVLLRENGEKRKSLIFGGKVVSYQTEC